MSNSVASCTRDGMSPFYSKSQLLVEVLNLKMSDPESSAGIVKSSGGYESKI